MAPYPLDKQTASCNSPHNREMSLAMDLAVLCDCTGENDTNGCHLAVFSEDKSFIYHFVDTCPLSTLQPCRNASGIGYTSKNYLKWQANQLAFTQ